MFYYHLGLHYSQTTAPEYTTKIRLFYYHLGLHYSQTGSLPRASAGYSFTTTWDYTTLKPTALVSIVIRPVLLPLGITLLSNKQHTAVAFFIGFTTTWDYTTLKPIDAATVIDAGFTTTWDYTTLKRSSDIVHAFLEFYYHLGLHYSQTRRTPSFPPQYVLLPLGITLLSNNVPASSDEIQRFYYHLGLHYSQTCREHLQPARPFYYHLGLHYSQTRADFRNWQGEFYYHLGLHYSQTDHFVDR